MGDVVLAGPILVVFLCAAVPAEASNAPASGIPERHFPVAHHKGVSKKMLYINLPGTDSCRSVHAVRRHLRCVMPMDSSTVWAVGAVRREAAHMMVQDAVACMLLHNILCSGNGEGSTWLALRSPYSRPL